MLTNQGRKKEGGERAESATKPSLASVAKHQNDVTPYVSLAVYLPCRYIYQVSFEHSLVVHWSRCQAWLS